MKLEILLGQTFEGAILVQELDGCCAGLGDAPLQVAPTK
jgi:hypothetical protein